MCMELPEYNMNYPLQNLIIGPNFNSTLKEIIFICSSESEK